MKRINTLTLFLLPCIVFGQIDITGRVIPWKDIDRIGSFEILLQLNDDTLLFKQFKPSDVQKPGQYPIDLFHVNSTQSYGQLQCRLRFGSGPINQNYNLERHQVIQTGNERNMEIEFHLQGYENGQLFLSEFIIKKIFPTPAGLTLLPLWKPEMESNPRYLIANASRFILYGQSEDGFFEGVLYKKNNAGQFERYYTGGYNLERNAEGPLYKDREVISTIRDDREPRNKFSIKEAGIYRYVVRLGFKPYELSSDYGDLPYFSVDYPVQSGNTRRWVKEYFELSDEFEIR